jgi:outer membrane protein OmpA-like peptidoglycan-associated protein
MKKRIALVVVAGLAFALAGCAGPALKVEPIPVTENPSDYVREFEKSVGSARQNQVNVLAPTWFAKAERSLAEAKRRLERQDQIAAISKRVSEGRAELQKAEEMANLARTVLPDVIKGRELARSAGATSFGPEYGEIETRFLELTSAIERNNLGWARRSQGKVIDAFRHLEIRAIKENTLGEVRQLIDQAEAEDARRLAPEILADAKKELQEVDAFISSNPYAKEEMHKRADVALFKAGRLVQLTHQAKQLRKMQPIETALWAEEILHRTAGKLRAPDMRDQPFDTQLENILGSIMSMKGDRDFLASKARNLESEMDSMRERATAEIGALRAQHRGEIAQLGQRYENEINEQLKRVAALEGQTREEQARRERLLVEKRAERERLEAERRATEERLAADKRAAEQRLAAERRFNQLYNDVQAQFASKEAEVYKQGHQLIIRLRAMNFPVGQALIMPENYPLLSKVQRAIRTFNDPDLAIEGHTDSTGAPEFNNHLSEQRAEAVRQYLIANGIAKEEKVVATGYGSARPMASNETREGRAVNRRIDLVLTPKRLSGF